MINIWLLHVFLVNSWVSSLCYNHGVISKVPGLRKIKKFYPIQCFPTMQPPVIPSKNMVKQNVLLSGRDDPPHLQSIDFLWCVRHTDNRTWLGSVMSADHRPYSREHFSDFCQHSQLLPPTELWSKADLPFDNEAASNSCAKRALICQSQTFVALQGLWLRHNTKSSLGWEVVSKINKAWKRRNYKHSAMKNEGEPSKQSVACSIFNSFPAWHKDGCQTTEETNGGWQRNGKKMREYWSETIGEFSIHVGVRYTCGHTPTDLSNIFPKKLQVFGSVFQSTSTNGGRAGTDLLEGRAAVMELLKPKGSVPVPKLGS